MAPKRKQKTAPQRVPYRSWHPPKSWHDLTDEEKFETTSEEAFKAKLLELRQDYMNRKSITKENYDILIDELLKTSKDRQSKGLKKKDWVEVDGVKKLVTPKSPKSRNLLYYAHDDELFHIFQYTHMNLVHGALLRMVVILKKKYKNIVSRDVEAFIKLCPTCIGRLQGHENVITDPMLYSDLSSSCIVHLIDLYQSPDDLFTFVLVYQNHLTKFCLLKPLKSRMAEEIATNLIDIFTFVGASTTVELGSGVHIAEELFTQLKGLCPGLLLKHVKTAKNRVSEEVENIKANIQNWMETNTTKWSEGLSYVQLMQNSEFHEQIETTPYQAIFGLKNFVSIDDLDPENPIEDYRNNEKDVLGVIYICKLCGNGAQDEDVCFKCRNRTHRLLPEFYTIWTYGTLEVILKEAFTRKLQHSRPKHNFRGFSRDKYNKVISQVMQAKDTDRHILEKYALITIDGVTKLIPPVFKQTVQYYVHDEELFDILHYTHVNKEHIGQYRMMNELEKRFKNISMRDIIVYLSLCPTCLKIDKRIEQLQIYSDLSIKCSVNLINFESNPDGDFKYVLVYQNHLTKFCLLQPLKFQHPEEIANILLDIFTFIGTPSILESQKDHDFIKIILAQIKLLWNDLNIIHVKTNQAQEELKQIQQDIVGWMEDNKTDKWSKSLHYIQLMRNSAVNTEIKMAPYEVLFGIDDVEKMEIKYSCGSKMEAECFSFESWTDINENESSGSTSKEENMEVQL